MADVDISGASDVGELISMNTLISSVYATLSPAALKIRGFGSVIFAVDHTVDSQTDGRA